jgi:hypothetical protein
MLKLDRLIRYAKFLHYLLQGLPADAAAFKAWLRQISQSTAESTTVEGGLLGLGGGQMSDAEKATLAEISSALEI